MTTPTLNPTHTLAHHPVELPALFDAAFNRADLEGVMALFTTPATMRLTDGSVVEQDTPTLSAALGGLLGLGPQLHNKVRRVLACEDLALVLMDWTLELRTPDGQQIRQAGTATQVLRRGDDGGWRLAISNPLGLA